MTTNDHIAHRATASRYCRCGDPEDMHMEGIFANTPGRHCIVAFCDCTDFRPLDVQAHCRGLIRPQG